MMNVFQSLTFSKRGKLGLVNSVLRLVSSIRSSWLAVALLDVNRRKPANAHCLTDGWSALSVGLLAMAAVAPFMRRVVLSGR
jgi:hypothetical protein